MLGLVVNKCMKVPVLTALWLITIPAMWFMEILELPNCNLKKLQAFWHSQPSHITPEVLKVQGPRQACIVGVLVYKEAEIIQ